jgi:hypothetical protein
VQEGLQQADFQTRQEIIWSLVKRIEVDQQHMLVVFRVSPPSFPPSSDNASNNWQDSGRRVDADTLPQNMGSAPMFWESTCKHSIYPLTEE